MGSVGKPVLFLLIYFPTSLLDQMAPFLLYRPLSFHSCCLCDGDMDSSSLSLPSFTQSLSSGLSNYIAQITMYTPAASSTLPKEEAA